MSLKPPKNPNYAATVVTVRQIVPLENCDNVVAAPLLGYQAIVGKDTQVGDVGILFTAETQLSEEYARLNNLHRHADRNDNPDAAGYLEDNRRVKALKFRGHRSDALFMPLSSLAYTGWTPAQPGFDGHLGEGETFDELNGHEICRKYTRPSRTSLPTAKIEKATRIEEKFFPKHFDTENFFKNEHKIDIGSPVVITQKLHGTSIRIGHVLVKRKLSWIEKVAKKFGAKIEEFQYDYVYGSRNVNKDPNNPESRHFYGSDIYTEEGKKLEGAIPKGYILFGELIGWASPGKPIQAGYTYNLPEGTRELYIYRVSYVNADGITTDLSWEQVKRFCDSIGVKHVEEIIKDYYSRFVREQIDNMLDKRLAESWLAGIPVDKGKVDEGVCIRVEDGTRPLILKAKSPRFLQHETKMLDKEVVDMEEEA